MILFIIINGYVVFESLLRKNDSGWFRGIVSATLSVNGIGADLRIGGKAFGPLTRIREISIVIGGLGAARKHVDNGDKR